MLRRAQAPAQRGGVTHEVPQQRQEIETLNFSYYNHLEYELSLSRLRNHLTQIIMPENILREPIYSDSYIFINIFFKEGDKSIQMDYKLIMKRSDFYIIGYLNKNQYIIADDHFVEWQDIFPNISQLFKKAAYPTQIDERDKLLNKIINAAEKTRPGSPGQVATPIQSILENYNEIRSSDLLHFYAITIAEALRFNFVEKLILGANSGVNKEQIEVRNSNPARPVERDEWHPMRTINHWKKMSVNYRNKEDGFVEIGIHDQNNIFTYPRNSITNIINVLSLP